MNRKTFLAFLSLGYILMIASCQSEAPSSTHPDEPGEAKVIVVRLSGDIAQPNSEISGMAWYQDTLILLPQYPGRFDSKIPDPGIFGG